MSHLEFEQKEDISYIEFALKQLRRVLKNKKEMDKGFYWHLKVDDEVK